MPIPTTTTTTTEAPTTCEAKWSQNQQCDIVSLCVEFHNVLFKSLKIEYSENAIARSFFLKKIKKQSNTE